MFVAVKVGKELNALKKELNLKSYEEVIRALLRSEKKLRKSYFGAFPELSEFKRSRGRMSMV